MANDEKRYLEQAKQEKQIENFVHRMMEDVVKQTRIDTIISLIDDGLLNLSDAAKKLEMSEEEVKKLLKK